MHTSMVQASSSGAQASTDVAMGDGRDQMMQDLAEAIQFKEAAKAEAVRAHEETMRMKEKYDKHTEALTKQIEQMSAREKEKEKSMPVGDAELKKKLDEHETAEGNLSAALGRAVRAEADAKTMTSASTTKEEEVKNLKQTVAIKDASIKDLQKELASGKKNIETAKAKVGSPSATTAEEVADLRAELIRLQSKARVTKAKLEVQEEEIESQRTRAHVAQGKKGQPSAAQCPKVSGKSRDKGKKKVKQEDKPEAKEDEREDSSPWDAPGDARGEEQQEP